MSDNIKEKLDDLLLFPEVSYRILDTVAAGQVEEALSRFSKCRGDTVKLLSTILGDPAEQSDEWDMGIPTWASGGLFTRWDIDSDFIAVFLSWDNPEDPAFVIVARAGMSDYDKTPGASDPWGSGWMSEGAW